MRELDNRLMRHIDLLVERYASLESARNDIVAAYLLLEESYENGGKLLVAGNGGSAADAEHICCTSLLHPVWPTSPAWTTSTVAL